MFPLLPLLLTPNEDEKNPYGETKSEFMAKYPGIENIAKACWFFGVRPEQFAEELKKLLEINERKDEQ